MMMVSIQRYVQQIMVEREAESCGGAVWCLRTVAVVVALGNRVLDESTGSKREDKRRKARI